MDLTELEVHALDADWRLVQLVIDYLDNPSEHNCGFAQGYVTALHDSRRLEDEPRAYWLEVIRYYQGNREWARRPREIVRRVYAQRGFMELGLTIEGRLA